MVLNASYDVQGGAGSNGGDPGRVEQGSAEFPPGAYVVAVGAGGQPGNGGGASMIGGIVSAAGGAAGHGVNAPGDPGLVSISYSGEPQAAGGAIDFSSGNTRHTFTASGDLTVTD